MKPSLNERGKRALDLLQQYDCVIKVNTFQILQVIELHLYI